MKNTPYRTRQNGGTFTVILVIAILAIAAFVVLQKLGDTAADHTKSLGDAKKKAEAVAEIVNKRAQESDADSEF